MRIISFSLLIIMLSTTISVSLFAQNSDSEIIYGSIQGRVVDKVSKQPLPGVNILMLNTIPPRGAASNISGEFSINNIPVGRYDIKMMFIGYEPIIFPEILVGSGKATILNAELMEHPIKSDEVIISAKMTKNKPSNDMILTSGRTFSVEEARRYAGGLDDPARLASSFAGVTTGLSEDNGIVVRGNSPKGILWMIEGIEVPNPNHFFGMTSFGGGGVSALSSMMLDNSDFLTGAFPAEYTNALSGVFDLKLKTGNTKNHEHTFQVGLQGIDLASEGPLFNDDNSSYAFNYRYSTLGLIRHLMPEDINLPTYQDLCFKINFPTKNAGIFSFWGIGFLDEISEKADDDTTTWKYRDDQEESDIDMGMGVIGLNHKLILGKNTFINSTLALTTRKMSLNEWEIDARHMKSHIKFIDSRLSQYVFSSNIYHKFSSQHYNKTGMSVRNLDYDIDIRETPDKNINYNQIVRENGNSQLLQGYTQSNFRINENLTINLGLSFQYFTLNKNSSFEPRAGIKWDFSSNQSFSLGYGLHSRLDVLNIYMAQQQIDNNIIRPNKNLDFTKAHHFVLGYDLSISEHSHLKVETYYQYLFDVPVIPDSSYSILNMEADWYFNQQLVNSGTGRNIGVDVTFERYLHDHYYYLLTASLFQSRYKGGDSIIRDTRFNRNFSLNLLGGKEWILGEAKNKILGVNLRFQILGGKKITPVNYPVTTSERDIFYDDNNAFSLRDNVSYHTHVTLTYRINESGYSIIWALQLFNFPSSPDFEEFRYNLKTNTIDKSETNVFFPSISFKIEF